VFARDKGKFRSPRVAYNVVEILEGSIVGETERIDQSRPQDVGHLNRGILSAGKILLIGNSTAVKVWDHLRIFIEAVSEEESRFLANLMVSPDHKIIFFLTMGGRGNEKFLAVP
jgi:hypothetical protein